MKQLLFIFTFVCCTLFCQAQSIAQIKKELETILKYKDIKNDIFVIDDLWIYEEGPYEGGNWDKRSTCGADNIDFVNDLFEDTHYIIKSYAAQGFIILFPLSFDITSDVQNLVVGEIF